MFKTMKFSLRYVVKKIYQKTLFKKYRNCLKNYTNFHQLKLEKLVDEAEIEEEEGIRLAKRKVRTRLINFRTHLINDLEYKASTIKTNMICEILKKFTQN